MHVLCAVPAMQFGRGTVGMLELVLCASALVPVNLLEVHVPCEEMRT